MRRALLAVPIALAAASASAQTPPAAAATAPPPAAASTAPATPTAAASTPPAAAAQPAPASPPPPPTAPPATPPTTPIVKLAPDLGNMLGHMVESQTDKDLGRIIDILVDPSGMPEAAVIDFGGFLGVGTRRVAVAWSALRFTMTKDGMRVLLDIPSDRIKSAPDYVAGKPIEALMPAPAQ